ncbi:hypothetical protein [Rhodoplanes sp. Z2-YC6860]|uniref:hypothetical protein n=1 Tax=Rhodoplanes sp. Z2-YC6860 TaxID=674703 RepID=UPI0012ED12C0|nr:hypothetical protein [Rhodoplanes sp. Z2-YC6860]
MQHFGSANFLFADNARGWDVAFEQLTNEQWNAIYSIGGWPEGTDWRRKINELGQAYREAQATRDKWVRDLRGVRPAKAKQEVRAALDLTRKAHKMLSALDAAGRLGDHFPHADIDTQVYRLKCWLRGYDLWIGNFAGKADPIKAELEFGLIALWKESGREPRFDRRNYHPYTPYGALIDFLKLALSAIVGETAKQSGIAKIVERIRKHPSDRNAFILFAMQADSSAPDDADSI